MWQNLGHMVALSHTNCDFGRMMASLGLNLHIQYAEGILSMDKSLCQAITDGEKMATLSWALFCWMYEERRQHTDKLTSQVASR